MSIPADTPAAVTTGGSNTTRSATGIAPSSASRSRHAQCVVARFPSSRPAFAKQPEPVHTDVSHFGCTSASHPISASSSSAASVRLLPPTTTTSGSGTSSRPWVARSGRPESAVMSPGVDATKTASLPGHCVSTS